VIGDKYTCFIAADAKQIGATAGAWLAERLKGKGKLVEIRGPVDSLFGEELHAAWRAAFRDPGYHFVFSEHVDPPRVDAAKLIDQVLHRVEQFDALFAYDDAAAVAAYRAAQKVGREKNVLFAGISSVPSKGSAFVTQGILNASFLHPTGGAEAIATAVDVLRGEKVPKRIVLPNRFTTDVPAIR
jgi:ribose transport system substrate-binding protein